MNSHDWLDWTNFGMAFAGLVASATAAWKAQRADAAAVRAEVAIRRQNADVDFSALTDLAHELLAYVEAQNLRVALVRASDLRIRLATAMEAHGEFLQSEAVELRKQQLQLKLVVDGLHRDESQISDSERVRLSQITGDILEVLASQSGRFKASKRKGALQ